MTHFAALASAAVLATTPLLGQDAADDQGPQAPDATPKKPTIERISETQFKIGKVSFDSKKRELSFPAKVNMTEGLLEYVIVMPHGKMHESLFVTEANPFDVNVAFKLLNVPAMEKYFPELDENFSPIPGPKPTEAALAASRLTATVTWVVDGKASSHPLHELIKDTENDKFMPKGRWLYTGSVIDNGKFQATLSGDILAILNNRASIINYNGPGSENDEIWIPVTKTLPPLGTDVTVTLHAPKAQENK